MEKDRKQKGQITGGFKGLASSSTSSSSSASSFSDDWSSRARFSTATTRTGRRKKVRKNQEHMDDDYVGSSQDPLIVFGSDIMVKILARLDAHSAAQCLLVSLRWEGIASRDSIWTSKCEELWVGKAHIPRISKVHGLPKLTAYSLAVKDGKRTRITKEDLCDHVWEVHFTETVPEYWRNLDPYWNGTGSLMHRYFHPDGSHTADPGDRVWGGHESCYTVVTSFLGDGRIREHYVRINRWPPLSVSRKQDWSWGLCNKIYIYASVPDPDVEEGTGPLYPIF